TKYFESGIRSGKGTFINGKLEGLFYNFYEDGSGYEESDWKDGVRKYDYVTQVTSDGKRTKIKLSKK
ncbi:MAG: hypothetical protein WBI06_11150, partial [Paludibacter sp.]